jgi:hypothetical protein
LQQWVQQRWRHDECLVVPRPPRPQGPAPITRTHPLLRAASCRAAAGSVVGHDRVCCSHGWAVGSVLGGPAACVACNPQLKSQRSAVLTSQSWCVWQPSSGSCLSAHISGDMRGLEAWLGLTSLWMGGGGSFQCERVVRNVVSLLPQPSQVASTIDTPLRASVGCCQCLWVCRVQYSTA